MVTIKLSDLEELIEISVQLCIITYLQSLVHYDAHHNIISSFSYKLTRQDTLTFLLDCQESAVFDLKHILSGDKFIQHL